MPKTYFVNEGGILGFENPSEKMSDEEYKLIKSDIDKVIESQTTEQRDKNKILSLKYRMEDYLEQNNPEKIYIVGQFLNELLHMLGIKSKTFAEFIGLSKHDLSKIINGRKKLNYDLALKLAHIFNVKPDLWIDIQNKNELLNLQKEGCNKYDEYRLEDLLAKAQKFQ